MGQKHEKSGAVESMFEEQRVVNRIINDYWKVFKYDSDHIGSDDTWLESVSERYSRHAMEYKYGPLKDFASEIALAFLNEIERLYRRSQKMESLEKGVGNVEQREEDHNRTDH